MSEPRLKTSLPHEAETKRRLLDRWLARGSAATNQPAQAPVPSPSTPNEADRYESFPLTDVQEAYWIGRKAAFQLGNVPAVSYTESDAELLDIPRLQRALDELVRRHDMLRAVIQHDGTQRVLERVPSVLIRTFDLRSLDADAVSERRRAIADQLRRELMTTSEWPLFRVAVSFAGNTRLHIAFDILFLDVQSVRTVVSELSRLYGDIDCDLPPLGITFRELVLAERASRREPAYAEARQYWLNRLEGLPPGPPLPVLIDPGTLKEPRFVRNSGRIPADRWRLIKTKAASLGLTPTAVVATAFAEVLARWSQTRSFTLNLTLYNRPPIHPDVGRVVGDFTNLLLLKVDVEALSFAKRALALQARLLEDMAHSAFSAVQVMRAQVARLGLKPGTSAPVVFTSNLLESDEPKDMASFLGDVVESVTQTPQVWLDHQVAEHEGALVFNWDCVEGLFPADALSARLAEFVGLVTRLTGDERWSTIPDVSSLRDPGQRQAVVASTVTAPPTAPGRLLDGLAQAVASVLRVESVEPDANLLSLGLDSIGVVRIANILEREIGVRPSLDLLFDAATVHELARVYERSLFSSGSSEQGVAISESDPEGKLILDPEERERFKQARPGIREDLHDRPVIPLPPREASPLYDWLERRRTFREFGSRAVELAELGGLLSSLCRRDDGSEGRYAYASAGGLYPVQAYLHVVEDRVASLPAGTYYYHPVRDALLRVIDGARLDRGIHGWINRAAFDGAAFSLFLIADENAMKPLYGNLTREFCLIEAGAMAQTLMLAAPFFDIGLCSIGSVDLSGLERLFQLERGHRLVHSLVGGRRPDASGPRRPPSHDLLQGLLETLEGAR